jgi:hypothetical protein
MDGVTAARIERLLGQIPGTIAVARLGTEERLKVVELEGAFERSSVLPIRNLGVRLLAERAACFALLKDARFRAPRVPTVYLVEDSDTSSAPDGQTIVVNGARRRVVGEEVIRDRVPTGEATIPLEESFVIYPDRRTGPHVPCTFILPPVSFPELEAEARTLGIRDILSISPSLAADTWIRSTFGFPPSNDLATLLVGCNPENGG